MKKADEIGRELPASAIRIPEVSKQLKWVWEAFWRLTHSRQQGFGVGGIPFEVIDAYAKRTQLNEEDFFDLEYLIRRMDDTFLTYMSGTVPKKKNEPK